MLHKLTSRKSVDSQADKKSNYKQVFANSGNYSGTWSQPTTNPETLLRTSMQPVGCNTNQDLRSSIFNQKIAAPNTRSRSWHLSGRNMHLRANSWDRAFLPNINTQIPTMSHKRATSHFNLPSKDNPFTGCRSRNSFLSEVSSLSQSLESTDLDPDRFSNLDMLYDSSSYTASCSSEATLLKSDESVSSEYLIKQIIKCSDQHASFVLQNSLDHGTEAQVNIVIENVVLNCAALMTSRFGNFLVQKCMTQCSQAQFNCIVKKILSNLTSLVVDEFGCHPVQKCLEVSNEKIKFKIIDALFEIVDITICHRFGYRVWQRLFQIPDVINYIMPKLNSHLKNRWIEVAHQEYGSLIVQNMFENCNPSDVDDCCEELIHYLPALIRSKHGHWVVLHILEDNQQKYRQKVFKSLLSAAFEFSEDQFGAKVIEKAIRIEQANSSENTPFTDSYVRILMQNKLNTNWIPLVHVASDRYGNYIVQCLLRDCRPETQIFVATNLKKQMVSLRGSKFGQKVTSLIAKIK